MGSGRKLCGGEMFLTAQRLRKCSDSNGDGRVLFGKEFTIEDDSYVRFRLNNTL